MAAQERIDFYHQIFDGLSDGYLVISPDWIYLYVNEAACRQVRKSAEELIGKTVFEAHEGFENSARFAQLQRCLENGETLRTDEKLAFEDGTALWFEVTVEPVREGLLVSSHDVTEQKKNEERITRLNRVYSVLSNVNQTIVRTRDLDELFAKVCRIAVDDGGFGLAWIGLIEDGGAIIPVASAGKSEAGLPDLDAWVSNYCAGCPVLDTIRNGERLVCNLLEPTGGPAACHESAYKLGFRASAAFPLKPEDKVEGFLSLYSDHERIFDAEELKLLDELAMDISFAMEFSEKENRRTEAELELRKSEDLFSKAFYLCPDAINVNRLEDGVFVSASWGFTRITGYTEKDVLGKSGRDIDLWVNAADHEILYKQLGETGIIENFETAFRGKTGGIREVSVSASVIDIYRVPHIVCVIRDVTEGKRTERALRETAGFLAKVIETSPLSIVVTDLDRTVRIWNPATEKMTGWKAADVVGRLNPLVSPATGDDATKTREKLLTGEPTVLAEALRYRADGTPFSMSLSGALIRDDNGKPTGLLGIMADLTEKKRTEQVLFEEREKLAVTLRSIGDAVIATDLEGRVTLMNSVAENMCGWSSDDAQGRPLEEVFHIVNDLSRQPCPNPVQKVLETDSIVELANHTRLLRPDGSELVIADSAAPIKDRNGVTHGVVLVFRDQTEEKRMQEHLTRSQRLDSLGVLAGGIAHDFNNLLGGIFGYLQLAEMECEKESRIATRLAEATGLITRARDLTGQLLTFSKGGKPARKPAALEPILRKSATFALSGSNVACHFAIADDLAPCFIDENQIGQVVDNIVLNAQQAMPMGGTIHISAENAATDLPAQMHHDAGYVRIIITDTGIGIPKEILPHIFDPFFTTKQKGNGLGLATCYSIIANHDGMIEVDSAPGKGTTFRILLPIAPANSGSETSREAGQHRGSGRVLIMDDQEFILEVTGEMLGKMGYTAVPVTNAESARSLFADASATGQQFAAIFLDLTIPGGPGGRELIGDLRGINRDIPIFALSGYSEDPVMAHPQEFGFTDSIRKPFKLTELSHLLNSHLKSSGTGQ